jgi:hypothetical protein
MTTFSKDPVVAISRVEDTGSTSIRDGLTKGMGKEIRGGNHRLDTVSCWLRYDPGREPRSSRPTVTHVYRTGDTRIVNPLTQGGAVQPETFYRIASFLKEQARISRIPQKLIIDGLHTRQSTLEVRLAVRPQCPRI